MVETYSMAEVLINEYWDHNQKKPIRSYVVNGGLVPPYTMSMGDDRYIMPGWYKLSDTEILPNINDIKHIPYRPKEREEVSNKEYKVLSSKGDKEYIIKADATGSLQCSCPSAMYRPHSDCKHIKELKIKN